MGPPPRHNNSLSSYIPQLSGSLPGFTTPPLPGSTAGSSVDSRPVRPRGPAKVNWDERDRFAEMMQLIARVAFEFASAAEIEMFDDGCKENRTFQTTAESVARNYYRRSKDMKNPATERRDDLKRANRLKEAMENARGVCLKDFFRDSSSGKQSRSAR